LLFKDLNQGCPTGGPGPDVAPSLGLKSLDTSDLDALAFPLFYLNM